MNKKNEYLIQKKNKIGISSQLKKIRPSANDRKVQKDEKLRKVRKFKQVKKPFVNKLGLSAFQIKY